MKILALKEYFVAFLVSLFFFALASGYMGLQFGVLDNFMLNRALGEASLLNLALVLLIGPLSRLYDRFDRWLLYRKEIGVFAFFSAAAHFLISGLGLPGRTWLGFYGRNPQSFFTGLGALVIFALLFILSLEFIISKLPRKLWWLAQNWGARIAGILIIAHVVLLRQAAWIAWFERGNTAQMAMKFLPPITVLSGIVTVAVILVRLSEFLGRRIGRLIVALWLLAIPIAWAAATYWTFLKTR
jgi:sulfoxide reductase heme-binding subunit YedZ